MTRVTFSRRRTSRRPTLRKASGFAPSRSSGRRHTHGHRARITASRRASVRQSARCCWCMRAWPGRACMPHVIGFRQQRLGSRTRSRAAGAGRHRQLRLAAHRAARRHHRHCRALGQLLRERGAARGGGSCRRRRRMNLRTSRHTKRKGWKGKGEGFLYIAIRAALLRFSPPQKRRRPTRRRRLRLFCRCWLLALHHPRAHDGAPQQLVDCAPQRRVLGQHIAQALPQRACKGGRASATPTRHSRRSFATGSARKRAPSSAEAAASS